MKLSIGVLGGALACAGMFFGAAVVFAEGQFSVQPRVEVGAKYNSNFWKTEKNEVGVNTYTLKPGVAIGYETARTEVVLDAMLEAFWYDDRDAPPAGIPAASDQDYVGFDGEIQVNHKLTDRLNVEINDQLNVLRDQGLAQLNDDTTDRDKHLINYFEPTAFYDFGNKFGLLVGYRNTITDYETNPEDSIENRGILDLVYNLNRTSALFLDYQLWERNYDEEQFSDYLSSKLALNYEKSFRYYKINVGGGYHHRDYDSHEILDELDVFSWNLQAVWEDQQATGRSDITTIQFGRPAKTRFQFDVGHGLNDDAFSDEYFVATYLRLAGNYWITERIKASAWGSFQNSDYETSDRNDDTYHLKGQLGFKPFEELLVALEAGYEKRDSNYAGSNYDDTYVGLNCTFDYDFSGR